MKRGVWRHGGMGMEGYGGSGITGAHLLHRYPSIPLSLYSATPLPLYPPIPRYPFQL